GTISNRALALGISNRALALGISNRALALGISNRALALSISNRALALGISNRALALASSAESNWPQWRGPDSQGISNEKTLPSKRTDTKNVLWKPPIPGLAFSPPIIWGKRVFLKTAIEGGPAPADHKVKQHMIGDKEFKHPEWIGSDKIHTFKVFCLDRD